MPLRDYQADAIASAYQFLRDRPGENPCIVIPTGGGKTPILSSICHDAVTKWRGRVLVLSHVKELVQQSADTLRDWHKELDVGVYSAGLKSRDRENDIITASIQSVASRGCELAGSRPFDLVLVDEAHRIPTDGDGQYQQLLKDLSVANPKVRVIGLTATPYRMKGGYVCSPEHFLNDICYEVSVGELIAAGYLSRLTSKRSGHDADLSDVAIRNGEYAAGEMEHAFDEIVDSAVEEIIERAADRKSVLIFCAGREHAKNVSIKLRAVVGDQGVSIVTGDTPSKERHRTIRDFRNGVDKFLCNINVLTEGFDATRVDMVVLLRATLSPGLYYQMVGRGLRLHEGKRDCEVLDFGGNVKRHGPIDAMKINSRKPGSGEAPAKECPECNEIVPISYSNCSACGYAFPEPEPKAKHEPKASDAAILSEQQPEVVHQVTDVFYAVHYKKGWEEGDPRTLRVEYYDGNLKVGCEWVCLEHEGFALNRACSWWRGRSATFVPKDIEAAVKIAELDLVMKPKAITTQSDGRFDKVVGWDFGDQQPEEVDPGWLADHLAADEVVDDEVPF